MPIENSPKKSVKNSKHLPTKSELIDEPKEAIKMNKKELESIVRQVSASSYRGPIPPPDLLAEFEKVLPGSADRILSMAERQSKHRQELENKVISSKNKDSTLGLVFAFILALVCFLGGIFLIYIGKGASGLTVMTGILVALVGVFVYGTQSEKKERIEKNKKLQQTNQDSVKDEENSDK